MLIATFRAANLKTLDSLFEEIKGLFGDAHPVDDATSSYKEEAYYNIDSRFSAPLITPPNSQLDLFMLSKEQVTISMPLPDCQNASIQRSYGSAAETSTDLGPGATANPSTLPEPCATPSVSSPVTPPQTPERKHRDLPSPSTTLTPATTPHVMNNYTVQSSTTAPPVEIDDALPSESARDLQKGLARKPSAILADTVTTPAPIKNYTPESLAREQALVLKAIARMESANPSPLILDHSKERRPNRFRQLSEPALRNTKSQPAPAQQPAKPVTSTSRPKTADVDSSRDRSAFNESDRNALLVSSTQTLPAVRRSVETRLGNLVAPRETTRVKSEAEPRADDLSRRVPPAKHATNKVGSAASAASQLSTTTPKAADTIRVDNIEPRGSPRTSLTRRPPASVPTMRPSMSSGSKLHEPEKLPENTPLALSTARISAAPIEAKCFASLASSSCAAIPKPSTVPFVSKPFSRRSSFDYELEERVTSTLAATKPSTTTSITTGSSSSQAGPQAQSPERPDVYEYFRKRWTAGDDRIDYTPVVQEKRERVNTVTLDAAREDQGKKEVPNPNKRRVLGSFVSDLYL